MDDFQTVSTLILRLQEKWCYLKRIEFSHGSVKVSIPDCGNTPKHIWRVFVFWLLLTNHDEAIHQVIFHLVPLYLSFTCQALGMPFIFSHASKTHIQH